jgi:hypothetical protein
MLKAINYFYSLFKNPGYKDFIDMGYGIEARYKRSSKYWNNHLTLCKSFECAALNNYQQRGQAAILGAGSLLDINIDILSSKFEGISLYDANSSLKSAWSATFKNSTLKTDQHFVDLTGSLETWTKSLQTLMFQSRDIESITDFLENLEPVVNSLFLQPPQVVFSINVLSQIPLYWKDRVQKILEKYTRIKTDERGNYAPPLQNALEKTMARLQEQHLKQLSNSGAKILILITDSEYLYYLNSNSNWQSEKALYVPHKFALKGFRNYLSDSWFWHIAPQGIEESDYGCIHNVIARAYSQDYS